MNKKLIAAAVTAGLVAAAPAAQAEIQAYSHVQFELSSIDRDGSGTGVDTVEVTDNQRGRFGFKGGHDLGGGLKSFALVEFDFVGGAGDAEFGGTGTRVREINAGLKGAFGSIGLGTVKSAYKYLGGVKYDPFVTTQLEQRGRGGMSKGAIGHNAFLNDAFVYNIKAGIAKIHATYSFEDLDRDGDGSGDDGEFSLGAAFGNKTWEAGLAIVDQGLSGAGNDSAVKIFGKVTFGGAHTILAQFENFETSSTEESDYMMLSYQAKFGKNMIVLTYGDRDSNVNTNDTDNVTLGYIHKFNKQSRVFAGYQTVDGQDNANDRDTITLGVRVDI